MRKTIVTRAKFDLGRSTRSRGFTLLEMMAAIAIMTIVIAVAVRAMIMMQTRSFAETSKVDTVQETRDFVDQMVRDIHDVGYPPPIVVNNIPAHACDNDPNLSCGLILFTPTQIQYEGDLDGTGTVYEVFMQLAVSASGNCPCILQRGIRKKLDWLADHQQPAYFTEVNGVLNSGNGANGNGYGAANYPVSVPGGGNYTSYTTADVFDAYFNDGTFYHDPVTGAYSCNTVLNCGNIRTLQITANVVPNFMDPTTHMYQVYAITSKARLNNAGPLQ